MKKFLKVLTGSAVFAFSVGLTENVRAQTGAGLFITNIATVAGSNFTTTSATPVVTTVGTQLGARPRGSVDATRAAGSFATNYLSVTNYGNLIAPFVYSLVTGSTTGAPGAGWSNKFQNGLTLATNTGVAPGGNATMAYRVFVPATAGNNSVRSWAIRVSNAANAPSAVGTNYTGDNGTAYGGDIAMNGAGLRRAVVPATGSTLSNKAAPFTTNYTWTVQVQAAVVAISKTAIVSNVLTGNGGAPIPGSKVTYKITLTNSGSSVAKGVEVVDNIPANTTYKASSLKADNSIGATYGSAALSPSDGADADRGTSAAGRVEFVGAGGSADATSGNSTGTLANGTGQSYFFRVTIN